MSGSARDNVSLVASALLALSDPSRLRVFRSMRLEPGAGRPRSVVAEDMADLTERIAVEINAPPALIEQHLLELQRAGLLTVEEGRGGALQVRVDEETLALVRKVLCETLGKADPDKHD